MWRTKDRSHVEMDYGCQPFFACVRQKGNLTAKNMSKFPFIVVKISCNQLLGRRLLREVLQQQRKRVLYRKAYNTG